MSDHFTSASQRRTILALHSVWVVNGLKGLASVVQVSASRASSSQRVRTGHNAGRMRSLALAAIVIRQVLEAFVTKLRA